MNSKRARMDSDSSSSVEKFKYEYHSMDSLQRMRLFRVSKQLTDVTLVASCIEIKAHRLVLSAASDYFLAMFTNDLRESRIERISLEFVDAPSLQALVEYFYTGEIDLKEESVETLLKTAKFLHINEVVSACCDFLTSRLDPSNSIGFFLFADALGCRDFSHSACRYIMDHFVEVVKNQEFFTLSAADLKTLLSNDMLNIDSEELAFKSLMEWIHFDVSARKADLPELLEVIKLPLLPVQFLTDSIEVYPVLKESPICWSLIVEALTYRLLPERHFSSCPRTKPRKSTVGSLYMLGGMDGSKGSRLIKEYNLRSNSWSHSCGMTSRRLQFGAAIMNDKLYVVGGRDGLKTLNIVECYDFKANKWYGVTPMSTHRHGLGVAVLGGPLYAVGGHDGWTYLSAVERWDPVTHQWNYVAPLNTQRSTCGVAVLNDKIYAVGGRDGSSCLRTVECFDPHTNRWTFCAPMSIRRGGAGVGVINGYLFAVGGHDAPTLNPGVSRFQSVERYDPRTDTWTLVAPMKIGRDAVGVGVLGNRLIAVGGYDGQSYLKIVEAYDPESNEWEQLRELQEGRAGMCVVVVKS